MAKKAYFPQDMPGQIEWLFNFSGNIGAYATKYGISATQISGLTADVEYLNFWFGVHTQAQSVAQALTAFKNDLAHGVPEGSPPLVEPAFPTLGTVPPAVAPGVFRRAISIGNAIKAHKDYTLSDGEALRLEGAELPDHNLATEAPGIKLSITGGTVEVGWSKRSLPVDALEIWVKRGAGDFVFLAVDTTTPKYIDTQAFPATEEKWTYKGIYRMGDGRIGLWSQEASVQVKA